MKRRIKNILVRAYEIFCRVLYGYRNAVVFVSFSGKSYSDNPKAISEKLHELFPDVEIVWLFSNAEQKRKNLPEYIKCIDINNKYLTLKWLSISKCVVNNSILNDCCKGKKQHFVQVWHGDRAFKKILYDSDFVTPNLKLVEEKEGFCDLAVAGSAYGEMQFRSAFRYKGEILCVGTPRNDILVNADLQKAVAIKKKLGIPEDRKIILYAPTLRRENFANKTLQNKQNIDLEAVLEALHKRDNAEWVFLVRAHPAVPGMGGITFNQRIINASAYEDMADLLLVSDFLITDYSSSAGDFALLHRPIILFQSDRQEYLENDREFYFNIDDSPYYVAENQEELHALISSVTEEEFKKNCDDILSFYETCETGKASETVAKRLAEWIKKTR